MPPHSPVLNQNIIKNQYNPLTPPPALPIQMINSAAAAVIPATPSSVFDLVGFDHAHPTDAVVSNIDSGIGSAANFADDIGGAGNIGIFLSDGETTTGLPVLISSSPSLSTISLFKLLFCFGLLLFHGLFCPDPATTFEAVNE